MITSDDKAKENKSNAVANIVVKSNITSPLPFIDNRSVAIAQRRVQQIVNSNSAHPQIQKLQRIIQTGSQMHGVIGTSTIQRYPTAMDDEDAKTLSTLHSTKYSDKKDDDFSVSELTEIKSGVFMLTDLAPQNMQANCIGWAQNEDSIEPTGSMYTWQRNYTATAADAGDAKIILWGSKDGVDKTDETKWNIKHASVLLTHEEIANRSKEFGGFSEITTKKLSDAGIENPCWTSAGGFGYGVFVHPRNWFEGGDFGTALKGMK